MGTNDKFQWKGDICRKKCWEMTVSEIMYSCNGFKNRLDSPG